MNKSVEALMQIDGLQYKFGRFGFVYYRSGLSDWHRSTMSVESLRLAWIRRFNRLVLGVKSPEIEGSAKGNEMASINRKTRELLIAPYINSSEKWKTMGLAESKRAAQG
ncbi:MAG: hypothetical protein KUG81_01810 [Gammaproteobacteria bacterium]|nr:hypothetical protein [Gammaproteobacteria bacterium]